MNTFAALQQTVVYRNVGYYSVIMDDQPESLFLQFLNTHSGKHWKDDLDLMRHWMKRIGLDYGAREEYFRPEGFRGGDARALPPPATVLRGRKTNLRLYCMRVSSAVVILFGGAEKTARTAQECPQVRPHFLLANQLSILIHQSFQDGTLTIQSDPRQLSWPENFQLILP